MPSVLNVGGASKKIAISPRFAGWEHLLLDIDPACKPDLCMDARELHTLERGRFDAVYCSNNLEHYHRADALKVLRGFEHVIKDDGFAEVLVPDLHGLMQVVVSKGLDIDDPIYLTTWGAPILVRDVIYGYSKEVESGNAFYAHKTGFTPKSLPQVLLAAGFGAVSLLPSVNVLELHAVAFKTMPSPQRIAELGLGG